MMENVKIWLAIYLLVSLFIAEVLYHNKKNKLKETKKVRFSAGASYVLVLALWPLLWIWGMIDILRGRRLDR